MVAAVESAREKVEMYYLFIFGGMFVVVSNVSNRILLICICFIIR